MNSLPPTPSSNASTNSVKNSSTKTGAPNPQWAKPVFFREWREQLMLEPFDDAQKSRYIRALATFFVHCKTAGKVASIAVAKAYVDAGAEQGKYSQIDRDALRWFFVTYRKLFGDEPPRYRPLALPKQPIPIPVGTPEWEAKLIRAIRLRGFQWNGSYQRAIKTAAQKAGIVSLPRFGGHGRWIV